MQSIRAERSWATVCRYPCLEDSVVLLRGKVCSSLVRLLLEQRLILLLRFNESLFEEVGVWLLLACFSGNHRLEDLLSLFANLIASVDASGSPSLTSAAAFQTQLRSLPTLGESFMSGTTTKSANVTQP